MPHECCSTSSPYSACSTSLTGRLPTERMASASCCVMTTVVVMASASCCKSKSPRRPRSPRTPRRVKAPVGQAREAVMMLRQAVTETSASCDPSRRDVMCPAMDTATSILLRNLRDSVVLAHVVLPL